METLEATRRLTDEQQEWLTDLYLSNFARVFRLCRRLLGNAEDAADAAHEVFLRAVNASKPQADGRDVGSWLLTVARNYCLDLLRRRQRLGRLMVRLAPATDDAPDPETSVVDRAALMAILDQLRERERHALWASAVERRSLAAIAQEMQLSYMAAAQLLHRARRRAALLAARLAAIFGLVQLGRLARRAGLSLGRLAARVSGSEGLSFSTRQLVAAAAVPIAVAALVVGSTPQPGSPPAEGGAGSSQPALSAPGVVNAAGPRALDLLDRSTGAVEGVVQQAVPAVGSSLNSLTPVSQLPSTVSSTVARVGGSVNQVTTTVTGLLGRKF